MTLAAKGVTFRYALGTPYETAALTDVSLEIPAGKVTLVMGTTGSGKSTLFRLLSGLATPTEGTVQMDGEAVHAGRVGMVFQQPESQLFSETVLADVGFGPRNLALSDAEADEAARKALRIVGLNPDEIGESSPFEISGGQARRVAIAGVIAMDQPYILFDEPTAGLDGHGRAFVRDLVRDLASRGRGIAIVSHDVEEFLDLADQAALVDGGRITWSGPITDLIANPALFERAHLMVPDILEFQRQLACMPGGFSLDVDKVAEWALGGFSAGGPAGHAHDHDHGTGEC